MAGRRRYKLLCPIARALDRVGDRWTLLILRDLHAGPARYSDLQNGLAGIANVTTRWPKRKADTIIHWPHRPSKTMGEREQTLQNGNLFAPRVAPRSKTSSSALSPPPWRP